MATTQRRGTAVPTGLRFRPFAGEADLVEIARLENAESEADGIKRRTGVDELRSMFAHESDAFRASRDVTLVELDGRVVAAAQRETVDTTDGHREYRLDGVVDPAYRGRGIGTSVLAENERIARARIAEERPSSPVLGSWSFESQVADRAILEASGFRIARWFIDMVRPSLGDIPDLPLPEGLEVRPIDRELARRVWAADIEAFADHWGGFDHSDENLQRWLDDPATDLSLWVVAFDGDEIAGGVLNGIAEEQNAALGIQRGWLGSVFTRRPWRRRGLASALIARSLTLLRERGQTSAALGVDADNPSGALGLYEGLGFEVETRSMAWRKEPA